ncbi:MAG: glycogen synthase GlgA [Ruminococcaceae bacterium]|nr:glycogen synthase GlgA [Oscillospiraceae bacterium]
MKVLFAASEATPFFASGGLGDVAGSLPAALKKQRVHVRVILPLYGDIAPEWRAKMQYLTNFTVPVGWRSQYCGLFELVHNGVTTYFLDNEYYFKRHGLYGFYDDGERFAFFSRAILEALFHLDFEPELIHCHDWQTALVPVYLNLYYRHLQAFAQVKAVFTIHNIQYQGKYGREILEETVGIGRKDAHVVEYDGIVNFMKGAIESADRVNTVSPTYAKEILDPWYGEGLDDFLRKKQYKLCGILNGIDTDYYDPATDAYLASRYTAETAAAGKAACKRELRQAFDLDDNDEPVVAMVTRLVDHKGLDLVRQAADNLVTSGMQLVILGAGNADYEGFFSDLAFRRRGHFGVRLGFIPELARKVYAGSDMFLMPSRTEPCGLSQMLALRYGSVPIVRETGGLRDTVRDSGGGEGNGFTFASYNAYDMQQACFRALEGYGNKTGWTTLVQRGMACDFSWGASAREYHAMYKEVLSLW